MQVQIAPDAHTRSTESPSKQPSKYKHTPQLPHSQLLPQAGSAWFLRKRMYSTVAITKHRATTTQSNHVCSLLSCLSLSNNVFFFLPGFFAIASVAARAFLPAAPLAGLRCCTSPSAWTAPCSRPAALAAALLPPQALPGRLPAQTHS